MKLEYVVALAIVTLFAVCVALLCYDIRVHKKLSQLDKELATARHLNTKLYEREALAAQEGR